MSEPGPALAGLLGDIGIASLGQPLLAGLLALLAVAWAVRCARRRPDAVGWAAVAEAGAAGAPRREPLRLAALGLRLASLLLLALALGDPLAILRSTPEAGRGLDLLLVVDASDSMRALDTHDGALASSRLELARRAVARFASQRVAVGDRVGLIVFGERAFTQCPLTSDGALLLASLERVEAGMAGGSTALGDALALATRRIEGGDAAGVVVLLSDGRSNAGRIPLRVAVELARSAGVRVHTVAIGSSGARLAMQARSANERARFERHDADHEALREVAEATGGSAFIASSAAALAPVYDTIDALERPPRPLPPRVRRTPRPEPLLAAAGSLLALEIALARVFRRSLP